MRRRVAPDGVAPLPGGDLTIKDVIPGDASKDETDKYILAPPNLEVREALKRGYLAQVMGLKEGAFNTILDRAKKLIATGEIRDVVETMLFSLYAAVPPDWRIKDEAEAKRYFQLFFARLGANPAPEFPSARGYADAVVNVRRRSTCSSSNTASRPKRRSGRSATGATPTSGSAARVP